jgi:hypothetical protein
VSGSQGGFRVQLSTAVIAAVVAGIVTVTTGAAFWLGGGIYDRMRREVAIWIVSQLTFKVRQSAWIVDGGPPFGCERPDEQLVSASCIARTTSEQVAIGPIYSDDLKSFQCKRYTTTSMEVRATAICFHVKDSSLVQ